MVLDVRGGLKNTRMNRNRYIFIEELLSNALDSYLIRKADNPSVGDFKASISVEFFNRNLDGSELDIRVSCTDNGAGFNDAQVKAFVTKDTTYKDDLEIAGIGQCKGTGRIQYFHYFKKVSIQSTFGKEGKTVNRILNVSTDIKEITSENFVDEEVQAKEIVTTIVLDGLKDEVYADMFLGKDLRGEFSVLNLRNHILINFIQRFISVKDVLGNFNVEISNLDLGSVLGQLSITASNIPAVYQQRKLQLALKDKTGKPTSTETTFNISHYKLNKEEYNLKDIFWSYMPLQAAVNLIVQRIYERLKGVEASAEGVELWVKMTTR